MTSTEQLKFKICVLGDPSVGKTSLIHHFCEGFFRESYLSTIGVAFLTKNLEIDVEGRGKVNVLLQIWDIGGQSIFSRLRANYLKGSQGTFILFDVTNKNTLLHIDSWIEEFLRALNLKDMSKIPILVIGNKIDLDFDDRLKETAEKYLNQYNIKLPIMYTSAKQGVGMNESFEILTKAMIKTIWSDK